MPGEEDFGIVPLEAQACGTPVVALGLGGATETVLDGETGVLYAEPGAAGLLAALDRLRGLALDSDGAAPKCRPLFAGRLSRPASAPPSRRRGPGPTDPRRTLESTVRSPCDPPPDPPPPGPVRGRRRPRDRARAGRGVAHPVRVGLADAEGRAALRELRRVHPDPRRHLAGRLLLPPAVPDPARPLDDRRSARGDRGGVPRDDPPRGPPLVLARVHVHEPAAPRPVPLSRRLLRVARALRHPQVPRDHVVHGRRRAPDAHRGRGARGPRAGRQAARPPRDGPEARGLRRRRPAQARRGLPRPPGPRERPRRSRRSFTRTRSIRCSWRCPSRRTARCSRSSRRSATRSSTSRSCRTSSSTSRSRPASKTSTGCPSST